MSKRIEINEEQLEAIDKIVEYLEDTEAKDYYRWLKQGDGFDAESHVMYSVIKVREMLNKIEKANEPQPKLNKVEGLNDRPWVPHDHCHSDRDGECSWEGCPQLKDNEPYTTGRSCTLKQFDDE